MTTTAVGPPVVEDDSADVEGSARARFARDTPRRGLWRRNWVTSRETRAIHRDRIDLYRESWRDDWKGALAVALFAIIMFFVMWLFLVPIARSLLVPLFESLFAFPHNWWLLRLVFFLAAFYYMAMTSVVTGFAAVKRHREGQVLKKSAWVRPMLICFLFASMPFVGGGYLRVPNFPQMLGSIVYNLTQLPAAPNHNWDLPVVPPSVQALVCPSGLNGPTGRLCSHSFSANGHTVKVQTKLSRSAVGITYVTASWVPIAPSTYPGTLSAVDTTTVGNVATLRLAIVWRDGTERYFTMPFPKG